MKIFLAGASGVVGRSLIPLLTGQGHAVSGTTRDPNKADRLRSLGADPVVVDAYDRDGLFVAVRAARPDAVIHQLTDLTGLDFASPRSRSMTCDDAARYPGWAPEARGWWP
jgi:uncharacterized protein YbjT (DUF2867 family)